ncbi:MAG: hypothetical protein LBO20_02885, partial [Bifidobacteriaceae bacterium]|nr:hypothetical protein [Bifidobacteriaceae bacterium]
MGEPVLESETVKHATGARGGPPPGRQAPRPARELAERQAERRAEGQAGGQTGPHLQHQSRTAGLVWAVQAESRRLLASRRVVMAAATAA